MYITISPQIICASYASLIAGFVNPSYLFFRKLIDPETTKSEWEVAKIRADLFFRLKPGEFVTFADGKDQKVKFSTPHLKKELPISKMEFSLEDLELNFQKIYREAKAIYKAENQKK